MTLAQVDRIDRTYLYWLIDTDTIWPSVRLEVTNYLASEGPAELQPRAIQAIIDRIQEALCHRGYTEHEARQMITRLIMTDYDRIKPELAAVSAE